MLISQCKGGGGPYGSISRIIHTLYRNFIIRQRGQLLRNRRSNDRTHIAHFRGSAGEDEGQWLAFFVVGDAVFG